MQSFLGRLTISWDCPSQTLFGQNFCIQSVGCVQSTVTQTGFAQKFFHACHLKVLWFSFSGAITDSYSTDCTLNSLRNFLVHLGAFT